MAKRNLNLQSATNFINGERPEKDHFLYQMATAKLAELGLTANRRAALAPSAVAGGGNARDIAEWIDSLKPAGENVAPEDAATEQDKLDLVSLHATLTARHRAAGGE